MTDHHNSTHQSLSGPAFTRRPYQDHFITGTAAELTAICANHRRAGTLITWLKPLPLDDGTYQMMLRLRTTPVTHPVPPVTRPAPPTTRSVPIAASSTPTRSRTVRRTVGIVTAILGAVAGLIAAAAYLIGELVELVTAHAVQILGVLALITLAGLVARSSSGRRHCPGC